MTDALKLFMHDGEHRVWIGYDTIWREFKLFSSDGEPGTYIASADTVEEAYAKAVDWIEEQQLNPRS